MLHSEQVRTYFAVLKVRQSLQDGRVDHPPQQDVLLGSCRRLPAAKKRARGDLWFPPSVAISSNAQGPYLGSDGEAFVPGAASGAVVGWESWRARSCIFVSHDSGSITSVDIRPP